LDGIITTFSVFVGAYASQLGLHVIYTLGLATLLADALAMSLGDYLSTKSENCYNLKQISEKKM